MNVLMLCKSPAMLQRTVRPGGLPSSSETRPGQEAGRGLFPPDGEIQEPMTVGASDLIDLSAF